MYKYTSERETYTEDSHTSEVEIRELENGVEHKLVLKITFRPKKRVETTVEAIERVMDSITREQCNEYMEPFREDITRRYGFIY